MGDATRNVAVSGAWTKMVVEGTSIWIYNHGGSNAYISLSFTSPHNDDRSVQHKNVFDK